MNKTIEKVARFLRHSPEESYSYEMENFYGDTIEIVAFCDGTAAVRFFNLEANCKEYKSFDSEDTAYNWAFRRGFRE